MPSGHQLLPGSLHLAEHPQSFLHCASPVGVRQPPASQGCNHSHCSVPVSIDCGVQGDSGGCRCKEPRQWLPRDSAYCAKAARRGGAAERADVLGAGLGRASTGAGGALASRLQGAVGLGAALGLFWGLRWVWFVGCVWSGLGTVLEMQPVPTWLPTEGCLLCCFLDQPRQGQPKSHDVEQGCVP